MWYRVTLSLSTLETTTTPTACYFSKAESPDKITESQTLPTMILSAIFLITMLRSSFSLDNHFHYSRTTLSSITSRASFLASSTTAFLVSSTMAQEECLAMTNNYDKNPRYLDQELQMNFGGPRTRGILVRRITGDGTPYQFPVKPVKLVKDWPDNPPFQQSDFSRQDENDDKSFYTIPKLVYHIDEPAVAALTQYYRQNIPPNSAILDICSSWVSHYPLEFPKTMSTICATGINPLELQFNDQLTGGYQQRDLNVEPRLPFEDASFDVVTCVVSIDYLIHPIEVLKEVYRVLRPGGKVIISQSNRCFPTKAVSVDGEGLSDFMLLVSPTTVSLVDLHVAADE